jgi:hypothetical protein
MSNKEVEKRVEARAEEKAAEFCEAVKARYEEQLAEIFARYGIEETPSIFEVNEEAWEEALANMRSRREEHVLDILSKLFPLVSEMRQYAPQEAARACLKWPSPERSKEAIQDIAVWLRSVEEEMEAQTTPGVLRALKVKPDQPAE